MRRVRLESLHLQHRTPSRTDWHRLGVLGLVEHAQQLLLVEDHLLAAAAGQIEKTRQLDGVDRASLFAHPAEDAAQLVDRKTSGYFSRSGQGLSAATMSMQWAGQAVAQRKQATHFTRPCSSLFSRCTPR